MLRTLSSQLTSELAPSCTCSFLNGSLSLDGQFHELDNIDTKRLETLFADRIFQALLNEELISEEVVESMRSWEHSGFNVYPAEPTSSDSVCVLVCLYSRWHTECGSESGKRHSLRVYLSHFSCLIALDYNDFRFTLNSLVSLLAYAKILHYGEMAICSNDIIDGMVAYVVNDGVWSHELVANNRALAVNYAKVYTKLNKDQCSLMDLLGMRDEDFPSEEAAIIFVTQIT